MSNLKTRLSSNSKQRRAINTQGGAHIKEPMKIQGDFIGRDRTTINDNKTAYYIGSVEIPRWLMIIPIVFLAVIIAFNSIILGWLVEAGDSRNNETDASISNTDAVNTTDVSDSTPAITPIPTKQTIPYTPTIQSFNNGYKYAMIPRLHNGKITSVAEFWMGVYEVTNEEFSVYLNVRNPSNQCGDSRVCIDAKASRVRIQRSKDGWISIEGYEKHPVIEVSWHGATEFCKATGGRLPSSVEWTKAASWHPMAEQRIYPWGNEAPSAQLANYGNPDGGTKPVKAFPDGRSFIGAHNMSGNVWEFVSDTMGTNRIWRGGGWDTPVSQIKLTTKLQRGESDTRNDLGFRCARSS